MTVRLHRTDAAHNVARFYLMDVQPDLFGTWSLIVEWGRIGQGGTVRSAVFDSEEAAEEARIRQQRAKERRGYRDRSALVAPDAQQVPLQQKAASLYGPDLDDTAAGCVS